MGKALFMRWNHPKYRACTRGMTPGKSCAKRGTVGIRRNAARKCACMPEWQTTFINAKEAGSIKNFAKTAKPYNLPKTCGKIEKGKWVKVGKSGYFKTKTSFGSAVDNCRVACRSCEKAEIRYLQRSTYSVKEFSKLVKKKQLNCAKKGAKAPCKDVYRRVTRKELRWQERKEIETFTRTIVKSVPVTDACTSTNNSGQTVLKCYLPGVDRRPQCDRRRNPPVRRCGSNSQKRIQKNGCPCGFTPMQA